MKKSTCVYLIHDQMWLMLYRNKKKKDENAGKYIGVGGKFKSNETPLQCAKREVKEETGFTMMNPVYRGIVYFTYPKLPDEKIWIYTCDQYTGQMHEDREGTLNWIREDEILNLNLWDGDRLFLKRLLHHDFKPFCFHLFYDENGNLFHAEEKEAETE